MSYHQQSNYKRQKLISVSHRKHALRYGPKIDDLGKLQEQLQQAIKSAGQ